MFCKVFNVYLLSLSTLFATISFAGGREGHGGDPLLAEFVATARHIERKLRFLDADQRVLDKDQMNLLLIAIDETRVELTLEKLQDENGGVVTSQVLDDPMKPGSKLIRIYRPWWKTFLDSPKPRSIEVYRYVAHEYFMAAGFPDETYKLSSKINFEEMSTSSGELEEISFCELVSTPITAVDGTETNKEQIEKSEKALRAASLDWYTSIDGKVRGLLSDRVSIWKSEELHETYRSHKGEFNLLDDTAVETDQHGIFYAYQRQDLKCMQYSIDRLPDFQLMDGEKITGEGVDFQRYEANDFSYEIIATDATKQAFMNYETACAAWREELSERLEDKLILADCGLPLLDISGSKDEPNFRKATVRSNGRFLFTRN